MSILAFLIPLSFIILVLAVGILIWAIRNGQYDDMDSPAWRVVMDDDTKPGDQQRD